MAIPHVKQIAEIQDSFFHGSKTVGAAAVQLTATDTPTSKGVLVKALSTNAGLVYVGRTSSVTANTDPATDGFELSAGEAILIEIDNANKIYAIASQAAQKVCFVAL